ncbi:ATP-binding protein [Collinsella intestinalis]|uniref:ATP-binding protein n=2 Tax=Coriobacteriaceae TaxID=84107 RepID=UPI000B374106|nr:ATP-binding protein [Collinsella intestinalis]MBM6907186.1 ATP-binding protein [Collinsella intestinalis]MBM6941916.1 ATP-binding protein [Collinsella intestinalis]OUO63588.1 ATP-binding protein [Collinsella sp. An268]
MPTNPFKPTAGKMPPILIGRQAVIDDFAEGLDNGAGAPGRLMLITGQRGYGKTVMLTELGRVARERGWVVVSETASEGMCARLIQEITPPGVRLERASVSPSIGIPGVATAQIGSASFVSPEQGALTLRKAIEARLRKVGKGRGIAFTIDEAQAASREDMVALATTLQHIIRDQDMTDVPDDEKKGVAFVFAALPSLMDELLNDKVLTFLRRSVRHDLGAVPLPDVRSAFIETVRMSGKTIAHDVALEAARATDGYPYMVQLVGYYMWRSAQARGSNAIERCDVEMGASDAIMAFEEAVCAPLYDGLTSAQRLFVNEVARDDPEPARVSDVAKRARRSASWAGKYRASLMKERVIEPAGHGLVRLVTPHFASYIKQRG